MEMVGTWLLERFLMVGGGARPPVTIQSTRGGITGKAPGETSPEARGADKVADAVAGADEETITRYQGSVSDYSTIMEAGLHAAKAPAWVTAHLAADQNAIGSGQVRSGVTLDESGKLQAASVNSAPGATLQELTAGIPNKQVGVTTMGKVRAAGGDVIPSPQPTTRSTALSVDHIAEGVGTVRADGQEPERAMRTAPEAAMTDEELEEIRARCNAATPGPWKAYIEGRDHESGSSFIMTGQGPNRGEDIELSGATVADHDFIAHARQDLPRLLGEIARLRHELGRR